MSAPQTDPQNRDEKGRIVVTYPFFTPPPEGGGIPVVAIFNDLWKSRIHILLCTGLGILLAIAYLNLTTPKYSAELSVAPPEGQDEFQGGLGAIDSITGSLGIGSDKQSLPLLPFDQFLEFLQSITLAQRLFEDSEIRTVVFGSQWDAENETWVRPNDPVSIIKGIVRVICGREAWTQPSAENLQYYLQSHVSVLDHSQQPIYTIAVQHSNPQFAAYLISQIHKQADQLVRDNARERSQAYIKYLTAKLQTITLTDLRAPMIDLISENERTLMFTAADVPYSAEIILPVWVSSGPTSPSISQTLVVGMILGLSLALGFVVLRTVLREQRIGASTA